MTFIVKTLCLVLIMLNTAFIYSVFADVNYEKSKLFHDLGRDIILGLLTYLAKEKFG